MKRLLFLCLLLVTCHLSLCFHAQANPFIVCDPQTGVQFYKVTGAAWVPATVPAQTDGSIKMDISTAPVGTSNLNFSACAQEWDGIPGEVCSPTSPFSFTRRAAPATSTGVKLVP